MYSVEIKCLSDVFISSIGTAQFTHQRCDFQNLLLKPANMTKSDIFFKNKIKKQVNGMSWVYKNVIGKFFVDRAILFVGLPP